MILANKFISESAALFVVLSLLVFSLPAKAQDQVTGPSIDVSDISSLPEGIQAILAPALESGDAEAVASAVAEAILSNPGLAVEIVKIAVRALPQAAPNIAGAATIAVFQVNPNSGGLVLSLLQEIAQESPALASEVSAAVFQNLPEALQHQANLDVLASTAAVASGVPLEDINQALESNLATVSPVDLATPIFIETPVSGT